jgi:uncharacterized membrane protein
LEKLTPEQRDKLIRDTALSIIQEESKKWIVRFKLTMFASAVLALGFIAYGFYILTEIASGGNPALAFMALAIALGVFGSLKWGRRALTNLRSLLGALETIKKEDFFAK